MSALIRDFRLALRMLRANPVLSCVALLSLALGIGANTAIFTLADQVLFRALPVRDPGQLVLFSSPGGLSGFVSSSYDTDVSFSWPKYLALRDRGAAVFSGTIARYPFGASLAWLGSSESAAGELVSGNYFAVLGVGPALGRVLEPGDDRAPGAGPVAVLSFAYWTRRFGANPAVLNQPLIVNGHPFTIVGVARRGFRSVAAGEAPGVFVPITMKAQVTPTWDRLQDPHAYWLNVFARLKPGVSREQAQAAMSVAWHDVLAGDAKLLPAAFQPKYLKKPLLLKASANGISAIRDDARAPLLVLMGMVGLVLVIACANVANLLLARAAAREKEIAVRISLGAGRLQLARQFLAESVVLALGGGALGLLLSSWGGALIVGLLPNDVAAQGLSADPDGRVLAFTLALSVATGLLFGLVPAFRASRPDVAAALREQTASLGGSGHARVRRALVSAQIALSVLLLSAAGLFAHSLYNLEALDPGFRADHLVTFRIRPALNGYTPQRTRELLDRLRRAMAALPGVSTAAEAAEPLIAGSIDISSFRIEGYHEGPDDTVSLHLNSVGPGFFRTLGIPLLAGREFGDRDTVQAPGVAVINQSLAERYFAGRNPIGLHVYTSSRRLPARTLEIAGVVRDSKYDDLREKPQPFLYLASAQDDNPSERTFYVRTSGDPGALIGALRRAVRRLDPNLPVMAARSMDQQITASVFLDRLVATLSLAFAALATVLAAVGLYGVVAWAVARRKREIGIRMALGAGPASVRRMILGEVLRLGLAGLAVAVPVWLALARVLAAQLFGVSARDPLALAASVALLSVTALAAGFIPAFRASRVDPIAAIRTE